MSLRLLILGGTGFLGGELTKQALDRGWRVTLFNRGTTSPGSYPEARRLQGDRLAGEVSALEADTWDACIDTCGYVPRVVRQACELLAPRVGHYQFVSSISVYADPSMKGMDEGAPVAQIAVSTIETIDGETYGPLKALCEEECRAAFGDRASIVRPGLIVGPNDRTDRFTYWPLRISEGGDVLVPDELDQPVQVIDVRDLAAFMLDLTEQRHTGTLNATGPAQPLTFEAILMASYSPGARLLAVPPSFLEEQGVQPWSDLPLWLPPDGLGMSMIDVRRAVVAGLRFHDLSDTVAATLKWWRSLDPPREPRAGMTRERGQAVLGEAMRRGLVREITTTANRG
ncbi:MAG TPA: hypothetical protein PLL78_05665 [Fimbriimonadaceae bacterium]|nr:hypothetical protein [Fimbriimonadaceae bacterium]HRJ96155.1 hypothetical protein [Fimbriimonadaceae bacterium]